MPSRVPYITKNIKQRIVYKTFTPNLDLLPVTGELLILTNQQAVAQSIKNLVLTFLTERYYNPLVGSTVARGLFEHIDDFTLDQMKDTILRTINQYEPRAINVKVNVTGAPTQNFVNIDILFTIALLENQQFSVPTIVQRIR